MSLLRNDVDRAVLQSVFEARVALAKLDCDAAVQEAISEWEAAQKWVRSESTKERSFLWFCDEFDLEPSAVRRAIQEGRE